MSVNASKLADSIKSTYRTWLFDLVTKFRDDLIIVFQNQLDAELDLAKRQMLTESINALQVRHAEASATLTSALEELFSDVEQTTAPLGFDELSVIEDIEVERFVKRAQMVTLLLHMDKPEIKLVEARFAELQRLGASINPKALSPAKLFESLKSALDAYQLPNEGRIQYADLFEKQCVPNMIEGYRLVNKILAKEGLSTTLKLTNIKSRQRFARNPVDNQVLQQELVGTLQQLNEKMLSLSSAAVKNDRKSRLIDLLETSEKHAFGNDAQASINITQSRQIEFVEKIINAIANDKDVDKRVRSLVTELKVPLAILAIKDPELFSSSEHPGRMLIRELTLFGQTSKDIIDRRLGEVASLVRHVRIEGADNLDVTSQAAESIWRICEQELESFVQNSRLATKARVKELRLKEAKRRVVLELREQLVSQKLPEEMKPMVMKLLGPWMAVRYLRYGHNSRPWLESLAYMRLTFDAIEPARDHQEVKRKSTLRKHLIRELAKRSARSTLPADEVNALAAHVQDHLRRLNEIERQHGSQGERPASVDDMDASDVAEDGLEDVPAMHDEQVRD